MSDVLSIAILFGAVAAMIGVKLAAMDRRLMRLSRLETKVDSLLKAAGVTFDPMGEVPPAVREALDRGETILAVKRFREATGAGLKEAKDFVDEVRRRQAAAL